MTVNELVEWGARKGFEFNNPFHYWSRQSKGTKEHYRNCAKQILSHPDLLVSREDEQGDKWIIPLVDAIKGME